MGRCALSAGLPGTWSYFIQNGFRQPLPRENYAIPPRIAGCRAHGPDRPSAAAGAFGAAPAATSGGAADPAPDSAATPTAAKSRAADPAPDSAAAPAAASSRTAYPAPDSTAVPGRAAAAATNGLQWVAAAGNHCGAPTIRAVQHGTEWRLHKFPVSQIDGLQYAAKRGAPCGELRVRAGYRRTDALPPHAGQGQPHLYCPKSGKPPHSQHPLFLR